MQPSDSRCSDPLGDGSDRCEGVQRRIDRDRVIALAEDAVNHYSPSYAEEPATRVFARFLEDAGIPYQRQPVIGGAETGGAARANLVIHVGPRPTEMLWLGHVDTVAAVDEGHAHATIEGGRMAGLGAADMKSGCAAALEALRSVVEAGIELRRGLCIALVVGEEEYGDGAAALHEHADPALAPIVVVGEPTGLRVATEHFGYLEYRLDCRGTRAHAALPEVGSSAVHAMMTWLLEVLDARRMMSTPERVAFNPRSIHGGGDMFAVAEQCEAYLDVHFAPEIEPASLRRVVTEALDRTSSDHPGCCLDWSEEYLARGYRLDPEHQALQPLWRAFADIAAWRRGRGALRTSTFRSHSDASPLFHHGCLPVVCGPGELEVAHTPHESVDLDQLEDAARLYASMFLRCCT